MLKLTDAKCPSCGAKLEVNDKLEKTICQYCGSTVLIEDAIQKFQLEFTGKVEIDGIKGRGSKIKQALKHKKLDEYDKAYEILKDLIKDDEFDIEALCEIIKLNIDVLEKAHFDEQSSEPYDFEGWNKIYETVSTYERLKKIDEEKESIPLLKDYKDKIEHFLEVKEKLIKDNSELDEYIPKIKDVYKVLSILGDEYLKEWYYEFIKKFDYDVSNFPYGYNKLNSLDKITRNGALIIDKSTLFPKKQYTDVELLKKDLEEFLTYSKEFILEKRQEVNLRIDKSNNKLDKINKNLILKIKINYFKLFLYAGINAFLIFYILMLTINSGFASSLFIVLIEVLIFARTVVEVRPIIQNIRIQKQEIIMNDNNRIDHI